MCGGATLAMLESSTSMKAVRETTIPMIQGLTFGIQAMSSAMTADTVLLGS
jgi:hypothetical protein